MNSQVQKLSDISNMYESEVIFEKNLTVNSGDDSVVFTFTANYSGYIAVSMEGDNLTSTWIQVEWEYLRSDLTITYIKYQETRNFHGATSDGLTGIIDIEYFPILNAPAYIQLGNNSNGTITEIMKVTYYY